MVGRKLYWERTLTVAMAAMTKIPIVTLWINRLRVFLPFSHSIRCINQVLTFAHSGSVIDYEGGDIFFVRHGAIKIEYEVLGVDTIIYEKLMLGGSRRYVFARSIALASYKQLWWRIIHGASIFSRLKNGAGRGGLVARHDTIVQILRKVPYPGMGIHGRQQRKARIEGTSS